MSGHRQCATAATAAGLRIRRRVVPEHPVSHQWPEQGARLIDQPGYPHERVAYRGVGGGSEDPAEVAVDRSQDAGQVAEQSVVRRRRDTTDAGTPDSPRERRLRSDTTPERTFSRHRPVDMQYRERHIRGVQSSLETSISAARPTKRSRRRNRNKSPSPPACRSDPDMTSAVTPGDRREINQLDTTIELPLRRPGRAPIVSRECRRVRFFRRSAGLARCVYR